MVQTKPSKFTANVGEEIGIEAGVEMISAYRNANKETSSYFVGRNILEQILAQPGCTGIKFFDAYNEAGQKVLVYVGTDNEGQAILKYSEVNSTGELLYQNGIVANRGLKTEEDTWWDF